MERDSTIPEPTLLDIFDKYSFIMFTFILGLFSAWSWQLLPHHIIHLFDTNRQSQLVVLFGLILFTLDFFNPETSFNMVFIKSVCIFLSYLIISKQSLSFFIYTNIMFAFITFIRNNLERYEVLIQKEKDHDTIKTLRTKKKMFKNIQKILIVLTIIIITYGVVSYFIKQHRDHYNANTGLGKFLLKYIFEGSKKQQLETGQVITF